MAKVLDVRHFAFCVCNSWICTLYYQSKDICNDTQLNKHSSFELSINQRFLKRMIMMKYINLIYVSWAADHHIIMISEG